MNLVLTHPLPEEYLDRIRSVSDRIRIAVADSPERLRAEAPDAEAIYGWPGPDILEAALHLRWVMVGSAGVEWALSPQMKASRAALVNCAGVFDRPIADHVFAFILAFSRRFHTFFHQQTLQSWNREPSPEELTGRALGIVGLGSIGREVARLGRAFGMRVLATRRNLQAACEWVDALYGPADLCEVLAASDYIVIASALTEETRGMVGASEIARMKPGAVVINIARGAILDEAALLDALRSGRLGGAGLDVFTEEPLPRNSPFWQLPNVLITPHTAGHSQLVEERKIALLTENLRRDLAGEPLLNVVDKERGY
ncbi:MAG: D-2-hydroxyacid dehydrogenase [Armatimonadetes bacterium]|nr:D-2-hydroxyacid dehydrogenase [Armatimonadota bacterium]